jgi:uncharacterized protein YfaS (alpha-2-macroglobulin family)
MTAYVLTGLHVAAEAGAKVDERVFDRGLKYLASLNEHDRQPAASPDPAGAQHTAMFVTFALALRRPASFRAQDGNARKEIDQALAKRLEPMFQQRGQLSPYGRLLLALALHHRLQTERARTVLNEILGMIQFDDKPDTAHVPVAATKYWQSWNSEIETNAWLLRALVAIDRKNPVASKLANWLALNRKQGRYWRSTQDTALAVTAIAENMTGEGAIPAEQKVNVRLDQGPTTTVLITPNDILGLEAVLHAPADGQLAPGHHVMTLEKNGTAPMHLALRVEFWRKLALSEAQGNGLSISRRYFKLGGAPQGRKPLATDDAIAIGDLIEVELTIKSDEDYEYLAFEDVKPAGCEPVQLQSGSTWGSDLWANVELRDDRVVFFAGNLHKGTHVLRYKLRAETPGRFHALPTRGFAMYAPEIHAQSNELRLRVRD